METNQSAVRTIQANPFPRILPKPGKPPESQTEARRTAADQARILKIINEFKYLNEFKGPFSTYVELRERCCVSFRDFLSRIFATVSDT